MRTLVCVVLFSVAMQAEAAAPLTQAIAVQQKLVALLGKRVAALPEYQEWQAAQAVLAEMEAHAKAEQDASAKKDEAK